MGYIFDALNRAQPPDDEPKAQPEAIDADQAAQPAQPEAHSPPADAGPDVPSTDSAAESQPSAKGDVEASASSSGGAFAATTSSASQAIAHAKFDAQGESRCDTVHDAEQDAPSASRFAAKFDASFPDDPVGSEGADPSAYDDEEGPGTLGAIEPIKTSRHIELNERRLKKMDDRIVMLAEPGSQFAEEYRSIRTSLLARWQNKRNLSHVITSATPQEGKTITSLNLGLTLAELRSRRTIIVEADLRLPAFAKLLKLEEGPGLVNYLRGEVTLEEATQRVGGDGAYLLAAGDRAFDDAVSLLSGSRMQALLEHLRQRFDHVVIDTPPVIELADAGVLGGLSDEVLLIARMRRTSSRLIEQAIQTLGSYNAPVGGVIATDHRTGFGRYYAYRYHYRYRYGYRSRYHDYRKSRKAA